MYLSIIEKIKIDVSKIDWEILVSPGANIENNSFVGEWKSKE